MKVQKVFLVVAVLVLSACEALDFGMGESGYTTISGSGNVTTKEHTVSGFTEVQIGAGAEVQIQVGEAESVTIETDNNIQEYIVPRVEDGVLQFDSRDSVDIGYTKLIYTITLPYLEGVEMSGGSQGRIEGELNVENFSVTLSGGSSLTVAGEAQNQTFELSGGSRFEGRDLQGRSATIDASGNSSLVVNVAETLTVTASGGSEVVYVGEPQINDELSGGSIVAPME